MISTRASRVATYLFLILLIVYFNDAQRILYRPLLKLVVGSQEIYQPLYKIELSDGANYKRATDDRAKAIEAEINKYKEKPQNKMIFLDVGSNHGYLSHYFADRGNKVEGLDQSPLYVLISNLVSGIHELDASFSMQTFDQQFVDNMPAKYHSAFLLSVLHHVINRYGLEQTKQMMAQLLNKVPILFVELALPDEDVEYQWQKKIPSNPLEIFEKAPAHDVKLLGYFPTHLSLVKRPLYMITRKEVMVNGTRYPYQKTLFFPYETGKSVNSMVLFSRKKYFLGDDYVIKEMKNTPLAQQELASYKLYSGKITANSLPMPTLIDYAIDNDRLNLVLKKLPGQVLYKDFSNLSLPQKQDIAKQLVNILADLERLDIKHGDLRPWNILYDGKKVYMIDFANFHEDTSVALLWLLYTLHNDADVHKPSIYKNIKAKTLPSRVASDYGPAFERVAGIIIDKKPTMQALADEMNSNLALTGI